MSMAMFRRAWMHVLLLSSAIIYANGTVTPSSAEHEQMLAHSADMAAPLVASGSTYNPQPDFAQHSAMKVSPNSGCICHVPACGCNDDDDTPPNTFVSVSNLPSSSPITATTADANAISWTSVPPGAALQQNEMPEDVAATVSLQRGTFQLISFNE